MGFVQASGSGIVPVTVAKVPSYIMLLGVTGTKAICQRFVRQVFDCIGHPDLDPHDFESVDPCLPIVSGASASSSRLETALTRERDGIFEVARLKREGDLDPVLFRSYSLGDGLFASGIVLTSQDGEQPVYLDWQQSGPPRVVKSCVPVLMDRFQNRLVGNIFSGKNVLSSASLTKLGNEGGQYKLLR